MNGHKEQLLIIRLVFAFLSGFASTRGIMTEDPYWMSLGITAIVAWTAIALFTSWKWDI